MAVDFAQFMANFIIAGIILRLLQIHLANTEWGKALAFIY